MIREYRRRWYGYATVIAPCAATTALSVYIAIEAREISRIEGFSRSPFAAWDRLGTQSRLRWGTAASAYLYTAGIPQSRWFVRDLVSLNPGIDAGSIKRL